MELPYYSITTLQLKKMLKIINKYSPQCFPISFTLAFKISLHPSLSPIQQFWNHRRGQASVFSSIEFSLPAPLPYTTLYLTHPYNWEHLKNRYWFLFIFVPSEPSWVLGFSWMFNWHWILNHLQCGFHSPFLSHLQLFTQFTQFSSHIDYSSWLNKACSFIL